MVFSQYYNNLPEFSQNWILVAFFFIAASVLTKILGFLVTRIIEFNPKSDKYSRMRPERQKTLNGLLKGIINVTLFSIAGVLSLGRFVDNSTLIWLIGLFGAGFGLSARPIISDIMAGASFVFEDTFAVGEKVEILRIEGVIESTTLRTTWLRSPSGELFTIPNGDIRTIRNFSRGRFSPANITLKIHAADLARAIKVLEQLGRDSMDTVPNLIEPWQVINVSGEISQITELTLLAKARFGKAAEMRTKLMPIVQNKLTSEDIEFAN